MSPWSLRCCKSETQSWKQNLTLFGNSEDVCEWRVLVVDFGLLDTLVKWVLENNESVAETRLV